MLATLIRILGDFDLAEEALADALATAVAVWPQRGVPENPRAWCLRVARNRAVDRLRRTRLAEGPVDLDGPASREDAGDGQDPDHRLFGDDLLRLFFTCCHPALSVEGQVALTLRTVAGLGTEEIGRAFLVPSVTMGQRLVRAKRKIRLARIPYRIPEERDLPARTRAVLTVLYLVFNEGYAPSVGDAALGPGLCDEAIRVTRVLLDLLEGRVGANRVAEVRGLLALMLLNDSRRAARVADDGAPILLEHQDRTRWDRDRIAEGRGLVSGTLAAGHVGPYLVQAAITAVHAEAEHYRDTDWAQIAGLYAVLVRLEPSPTIELNRAVAVSMVDGPAAGLALMDALDARGELAGYHWLPAARAEQLTRLGRTTEARSAFQRARAEAGNAVDRQFLAARLRALD